MAACPRCASVVLCFCVRYCAHSPVGQTCLVKSSSCATGNCVLQEALARSRSDSESEGDAPCLRASSTSQQALAGVVASSGTAVTDQTGLHFAHSCDAVSQTQKAQVPW